MCVCVWACGRVREFVADPFCCLNSIHFSNCRSHFGRCHPSSRLLEKLQRANRKRPSSRLGCHFLYSFFFFSFFCHYPHIPTRARFFFDLIGDLRMLRYHSLTYTYAYAHTHAHTHASLNVGEERRGFPGLFVCS